MSNSLTLAEIELERATPGRAALLYITDLRLVGISGASRSSNARA